MDSPCQGSVVQCYVLPPNGQTASVLLHLELLFLVQARCAARYLTYISVSQSEINSYLSALSLLPHGHPTDRAPLLEIRER